MGRATFSGGCHSCRPGPPRPASSGDHQSLPVPSRPPRPPACPFETETRTHGDLSQSGGHCSPAWTRPPGTAASGHAQALLGGGRTKASRQRAKKEQAAQLLGGPGPARGSLGLGLTPCPPPGRPQCGNLGTPGSLRGGAQWEVLRSQGQDLEGIRGSVGPRVLVTCRKNETDARLLGFLGVFRDLLPHTLLFAMGPCLSHMIFLGLSASEILS